VRGGIGDWIARRAHRRPAATAVVDCDSGTGVSYGRLAADVAALAGALHERGVRRGDRVAVLMENSPEFLRVLFASANLGAIAVPVSFRLAPAEVAYILADSGAVALAVSDRFADLAGAALDLGGHGVRRVVTERRAGPLAGIRADTLDALAAAAPPRDPDPLTSADDICVIMYTSGTTGRPKGAMLTHGNMLWNAVNLLTVGSGVSGSSVTVAAAPMFHIGALGISVLPILYAGGTVLTVRAFDPRRLLELVQEHRVTTQFLVPAMWAAVSRVDDFDTFDVSSVGYALCGGAPCPLPVIDFFQRRGWSFLEGFGMTEAAPNTLLLDDEFVVSHAGSVGRPFMHVDVRIVDPEEHDVAVGEVGELVLRGPNVFAGYWGRPGETAEATRGGWFHTGDLGRIDRDGFVTLVDRKKDMIISGGENVYPVEVEQVLYGHPGVADVAVIGLADERWGETVVAVVVPAGDGPPTADELIGHTRERIAHFKCPTRVEFLDELPRTATGKVLKRTLRERYGGAGASVRR
jgi:fatty-acyl-CoA synthase